LDLEEEFTGGWVDECARGARSGVRGEEPESGIRPRTLEVVVVLDEIAAVWCGGEVEGCRAVIGMVAVRNDTEVRGGIGRLGSGEVFAEVGRPVAIGIRGGGGAGEVGEFRSLPGIGDSVRIGVGGDGDRGGC